MKIESKEELIGENNRTEVAEKVGKKGVHVFFAFNPIWIIWTLIKNARRDKKNREREIWIEYSNLVNYMPIDFLQLLTTRNGENELITPQESFMNYFSNKKVKDDPFASSRFIEYFHSNQRHLEEKIIREKSEWGEGLDYVNGFWREFEHILVHSTKPKKKEKKLLDGCESIKICRRVKKLGKVLLSGTGKYHLSARNNSYLRINKA